jgi:PII-like signaling protein
VKIEGEGQLLRIFVDETDQWHGQALYQAIVLKAKELGLAGATVLRGMMGFGAHSRIHTTKVLQLSEDLPVVIEIVDQAERIQSLLPVLEQMVGEGLITLEKIHVIAYRSHRPPKG